MRVLEAGPQASHPVIVDGCFGWLHRAGDGGTAGGDMAVLICPAVGWDGLHAHHGFRLLADRLAQAGYPTMRFQYPGTANSADIAPGEGHWPAWQRSVDAAAGFLRAATGARRLVLIGLRIGATLATLAAERRDDVDALVLLAPVLRGKSYIRQLDMEARLESGAPAEPQSGLDFHELSLSEGTVAQISQVDLRRVTPRAGVRAVIVPQGPSQLVEACATAWEAAGVPTDRMAFDGLEPMMQDAIHADLPVPDFDRVFAWIQANAPAAPLPPAPLPAVADPVLRLPGCTETPLRFGPAERLFGVLCRPDGAAGRTAVIILNTGRDPHYGIARFGVEFARRLASEGVASLRMDFSGLGDSPAAPGCGPALSPLFEADRTADIAAAIDALGRLGFDDFAVQGLCSGAYHAFRAAQADARLRTLLLVNLPVFEWKGGDSVTDALWTSAPISRLLHKLSEKAAWKRVLQGQVGVRAILRGQTRRVLARGRAMLGRHAHRFGPATPQTVAERAMETLTRNGARALFLYSMDDPGLDPLEVAFGREGEGLRAAEGARLRIVAGMDHVISTRPMRRMAADEMVSFLGADRAAPTVPERPA